MSDPADTEQTSEPTPDTGQDRPEERPQKAGSSEVPAESGDGKEAD